MGKTPSGIYNELEDIDWCRVNLRPRHCNQCNNTFMTLSEFKIHVPCYKIRYPHLYHFGDKKIYECKYCDQRTLTVNTLVEHVRFKHLDEKTYKCNHCYKLLEMKHNLFKHLQQSHYSSPCLVRQCSTRLLSRLQLLRHMKKKHPGVEVTECSNCRRLMQADAMRKHIMTCVAVVPEDGKIQVD